MRTTRMLAVCVATLFAAAIHAQSGGWIGTWGASPLPPSAGGGPFAATPGFENQTIRQIVRISAGGEALRIRLTNEYGTRPLAIGAVSLARTDRKGAIRLDTLVPVTFGGERSATIAAGAPLVSDALDFDTDDLESLAISIFVPNDTGPCTCHQVGMQDAFVSAPGNFADSGFEPAQTIQSRVFLSGIEVTAGRRAGTIVMLGDSITDGVGSTPGANLRWPDLLAERLESTSGPTRGIVNEGISGNRLLSDGAGESALARFDRDVLSAPDVTHVVVFLGVNDLGFAFGIRGGPLADAARTMPQDTVTAESMINGYRQLIARAKTHGVKVIGATITPYEGASYFDPRGEAIRQRINAWIRDGGEFDGVIDFDAAVRDPENPSRMAPPLHAGDSLHGSDEGYRVMAAAIDLGLFE